MTLYQPQYRTDASKLYQDYGEATKDKAAAYRALQYAQETYGKDNVCMVFYVDGYKHP